MPVQALVLGGTNAEVAELGDIGPGGGGIGGIAVNAATTYTSGTVVFSNSNGVTFGTNAQTITATVKTDYLTTAALSNHSHGNPTLALTNLSGTTASASNGLTLSLSAAAPGGGAAIDRRFVEIMDGARMTTCALLNNATYSNRVIFVPFLMKEGASLSVNTVELFLSRTGGTILLATMGVAFYTVANSSSLNLSFSTTHVFSVRSSVSWSGIRGYQFTGMGASQLSAGEWVLGFYNSAAASNSIGLNAMGGDGFVMAGYVFTGTDQTSASHSASHLVPFWGVWNATTAGFPSAVARSSISGGNAAANSPDLYAVIREI